MGLPAPAGVRGDARERAYPADFICEAIDQTRGWFYTLMAIGTLVFDESSYRNVLCLGHILAEDGRKMSKHLGNILEPIPLMDQHGADAVRWFMAASGSPWAARRVGHGTIQEIVRKVLLTYWNTVAFQVLYARTSGWTPQRRRRPRRRTGRCWTGGRSPRRTGWPPAVTEALEVFDTQRAGSLLAAYVDDLSNWYVRRSRRRFWAGDPAALATLHECLHVVTLLMAPITPFITERVWQDLFAPTSPDAPASVHLAAWPRSDGRLVDDELGDPDGAGPAAGRARPGGPRGRQGARPGSRCGARWWPSVGLGPADRRAAGRGRRGAQRRCGRAAVARPGPTSSTSPPRATSGRSASGSASRPPGRGRDRRGRRVGARRRAGRRRHARPSPSTASRSRCRPTRSIVSERPREGWSVVNEQGETVALDLELTPELVRAGLAREVVRLVQEARKSSGFDVSDRIVVRLAGRRRDRARRCVSTPPWSPRRCWRPRCARATRRRSRLRPPTGRAAGRSSATTTWG